MERALIWFTAKANSIWQADHSKRGGLAVFVIVN